MDKLNEHLHEALTTSVVELLNQNNISSVLDFLIQDVSKLATLSKLPVHKIISMRCDLLNKFSAKIIRGDELVDKLKVCNHLSTGIKILDDLIGQGLPSGISEVCGLAGTGKTQLCITIAMNTVKSFQHSVLYVDTKGDFSAVNLQNYLENNGYNVEEMAAMMERIKVIRIWNMQQLVSFFQQLKMEKVKIDYLRLIIVDSVPCLMFQFLGDESKIGLTLLNKFVNLARYLTKELNIALICVNILTRWVEQAPADIEDDDHAVAPERSGWVEKKYRCLGRYWQHIPTVLLELELSSNNISVVIKKSTFSPCNVGCNLTLSNAGVI